MDAADSFPGNSLESVELVMAMEEALPEGPDIAQIVLAVEQHFPTWSPEQRLQLAHDIEEALRGERPENGDASDGAIGVLARTLGPKTPRSGGTAQNPD